MKELKRLIQQVGWPGKPLPKLAYLTLAFTLPALGLSANTEDPLNATRVRMLAKFDANQDGKLDAPERETMRLTTKKERMSSRRRRGGGSFKIPASFLAKHDKDKDGEMSPSEWGSAEKKEKEILVRDYDAEGDEKLNTQEKKLLMKAVSKGAIKGIPAHYARQLANDGRNKARRGEKRVPEHLVKSNHWLSFDRDEDGLASREELEAIRGEMRHP